MINLRAFAVHLALVSEWEHTLGSTCISTECANYKKQCDNQKADISQARRANLDKGIVAFNKFYSCLGEQISYSYSLGDDLGFGVTKKSKNL